jgi:mRNA interferase YafQ
LLNITYTSRFKKDYKRIQKQDKNLSKLQVVIALLANEQLLPSTYKDHPLIGNWNSRHECHMGVVPFVRRDSVASISNLKTTMMPHL